MDGDVLRFKIYAESLVEGIDVNQLSDLLDEYGKYLHCSRCGVLPEVGYCPADCDHNICHACVAQLTAPEPCRQCGKNVQKDRLFCDNAYLVYLICYNYYTTSKKGQSMTTPDVIQFTRNSKKSLEYHLQDECRKLFKKTNISAVELQNVENLLNIGANPNILNKDGWTLLHEAVDYEDVQVLQLLLKARANVNAYCRDRCTTPLHDALDEENINYDVIRTLVAYGADIAAKDPHGLTPLQKARVEDPSVVELLLETPRLAYTPPTLLPERPLLIYPARTLSHSQLAQVSLFCFKFKAKLVKPGQKFSSEVSHVVVNESPCEASQEVLLGIIRGCYIVTTNWIEESSNDGVMLKPDLYEVTGTKDFPDTNVTQQSRQNLKEIKPLLFAKGQFHLLDTKEEKLNPNDKDNLIELIQAGGGKVLTRFKHFDDKSYEKTYFLHAERYSPLAQCCVISLYKKKQPSVSSTNNSKCLPISWLYEAIQTFKVRASPQMFLMSKV